MPCSTERGAGRSGLTLIRTAFVYISALTTGGLFAWVVWAGLANRPERVDQPPPRAGEMLRFELADTDVGSPEISWSDAEGRPVTLAKFSGKVVLLNYWASWCPPCLAELPSLNRLQTKIGGDDFVVVAVNTDQGGKPVAEKFATQLKLDALDLYLDPQSASYQILGGRVMPMSYLFDRQGTFLGLLRGSAEWDSPDAIALMSYFKKNPGYAKRLFAATPPG